MPKIIFHKCENPDCQHEWQQRKDDVAPVVCPKCHRRFYPNQGNTVIKVIVPFGKGKEC